MEDFNKTEFLLDMLDYYTIDPEARRCNNVEGGGCTYSPIKINKPTSQGCAIGRKLSSKLSLKIDNEYGLIAVEDLLKESDVLDLPEWINEHNIPFLTDVQALHDIKRYWFSTGLSPSGTEKVRQIITDYKLDLSQFTKYLN